MFLGDWKPHKLMKIRVPCNSWFRYSLSHFKWSFKSDDIFLDFVTKIYFLPKCIHNLGVAVQRGCVLCRLQTLKSSKNIMSLFAVTEKGCSFNFASVSPQKFILVSFSDKKASMYVIFKA